ncbi:MAG: Signal peptidase I T [Opitutia bacterium UBA7350]|nr:MAG: Signal peptidase I T [Opitutae bacterium UBA7350]
MNKLKKEVRELLLAAEKVRNYRGDITAPEDMEVLVAHTSKLQSLIKEKDTPEASYRAEMEPLQAHLKKIGGKIYPKTFLSDNIEVILVAAVVVIGIRSFFFQPFIIPTNSMYPTYSGMKEKVYAEDDVPNTAEKVIHFITNGARHKNLVAKHSGELSFIKARTEAGDWTPLYEVVKGRKWFGLFPAQFKAYTFYVGETPHVLKVPAEFQMSTVLNGFMAGEDVRFVKSMTYGRQRWTTGREIKAGESIIAFDIQLGDALFVDRLSYHFRKPKVGDPFVFKTEKILEAVGRATGDYTPKYYIKRLAGEEGETLEIKQHALLVDGQAREAVAAFERNAAQDGEYVGYQNEGLLSVGATMKVPEDRYVALGDNSANSADSRYWGFVPQESVVGRAFFIYYPFTKRWGPAE